MGETFGERVRFYRERRGLTQAQLAQAVGRGPSMLAAIERGSRQIHADEMVTFARALEVQTGALLGSDEGDLYATGFNEGWRAALGQIRTHAADLLLAGADDGYTKEEG